MERYCVELTVQGEFDEVLRRVREAFAAEGFGVVTEMNVQATLSTKIGKDIGPYVVLGMCNPRAASEAIELEPSIGVLLPCNVLVRQSDAGVLVAAQDPVMMVQATGNPALEPLARNVAQMVRSALSRLA